MFDMINQKHLREQRKNEELAIINEAANEIIPSDENILSEEDELDIVDGDSISDSALSKALKAIDDIDDEEAFDDSIAELIDGDEDLEE